MLKTLTSRLYATFALVLAIVLLGVGSYVAVASTAASQMRKVYQQGSEGAVLLARVQDSVWSLRWGTAQYTALGDGKPEARAKILEADPTHFKTVTESLAAYAKLDLTAEETAGAAELKTAFIQYYEARKPWFDLMAQGKAEEATELRARTTTPFGAATVKALVRQFELQKAGGEADIKSAAEAEARMQKALIGLAMLLLLPVPAIWWLSKSISRPINDAVSSLERVAQGDLSGDIPRGTTAEIDRLMGALRSMQQQMRGVISGIRQSADSIGVASAEVATGNLDLSQRTEQTSSNLQQTASAMEQLTSTVKQTADSARTANQLASSAATVAAKGGDVVAQVVSTMNEINTSSKKIADIIGTIDGIAFQTNILALNAAVEAARAGEQGRGFAVVASEVRSLAQRSAEAAREIKSLIGSSVEKVESGSRLVADAGSTMNEIVTSVQRVSDVISEITAATSEQSSGIGSVNQSVAELDQMTQQNAALVEEGAAAAASLKDQAGQLVQAVAHFRTGAVAA